MKTLGMRGNNRLRLKLIISLVPGVHLRELQRLLGVSFNSTRYHVDRLERAGEVIRVKDGGFSRVFPPGVSELERLLFPLVRAETDSKILANMVEERALSSKQLIDLTGLAKSTVSEHLTELTRLGIVRARETNDAGVVYQLEQPEQVRLLLISQNHSLLRKAGDRFTDLWDF